MTVKLTLIPSRGKPHIFRGNEVIVMKRGSNVVGRISLSKVTDRTTVVAFVDEQGRILYQTSIGSSLIS